jgi:Transposase IS4
MKGVDQADQLRANFTCHCKQNYRTWWLLFYFLIDVACVNAYLLWKWSSTANSATAERTYNGHRDFMKALCTQLLHSNDPIKKKERSPTPPTQGLTSQHKQVPSKVHGRCEWGRLHPPGCPRKRSPKKRAFGADITSTVNNGASEAILGGSTTHMKCGKCQIFLCIEGECWRHYHNSIGIHIHR